MEPKTCAVEECEADIRTRGLCNKHYQRLLKHGDPLKIATHNRPKHCIFEGCDRAVAGRGLCKMHWKRWRTHGDPSIVAVGSKPTYVGCKVEGCERPHHTIGYCTMHAQRFKTNGDPLIVGNHYPGRPRMAQPSYAGIHKRIFYDKGKASAHLCVDCGKRAAEWSYDGGCPNELYETLIKVPVAYSTDQSRYSPRCIPCHRRRDDSSIRARDASGAFAITI